MLSLSPVQPGPQAADAAHVEPDLDPGPRCVVEGADDVSSTREFIFARISAAWPAAARRALALDERRAAVSRRLCGGDARSFFMPRRIGVARQGVEEGRGVLADVAVAVIRPKSV